MVPVPKGSDLDLDCFYLCLISVSQITDKIILTRLQYGR